MLGREVEFQLSKEASSFERLHWRVSRSLVVILSVIMYAHCATGSCADRHIFCFIFESPSDQYHNVDAHLDHLNHLDHLMSALQDCDVCDETKINFTVKLESRGSN